MIKVRSDFEKDISSIIIDPEIASGNTFSYQDENTHEGRIDLIIDKEKVLRRIIITKASKVLPKELLKSKNSATESIKYDDLADSAYIPLVNISKDSVNSTYPFSPYEVGTEINLDFDEDERLLGIEVLSASKHLPSKLLK